MGKMQSTPMTSPLPRPNISAKLLKLWVREAKYIRKDMAIPATKQVMPALTFLAKRLTKGIEMAWVRKEYLSQQHQREHNVSAVLRQRRILPQQTEVRSTVNCYDPPQVVDSYCEADEEGSHEAEQPPQRQALKHLILFNQGRVSQCDGIEWSESLALADVEPEKYDFSVLDNVLLALLDVLSLGLYCVLVAVVHQVIVLHYLGADEALFKVSVDGSCCLGSLGEFADSPAPHFVRSCREEVDQVQGVVAGLDYLGQHGPLVGLVVVKLKSFMLRAVRDDLSRAVSIDIVLDLLQPLVLLAQEVLSTQVDQVDDLLGSDEAMSVEEGDVAGLPLAVANPLVLGQQFLNLDEDLLFLSGFLLVVTFDDFFNILQAIFDILEVLEHQFAVDDVHVPDRVH